jgi:hypothetical protein
MVADAVHVEPMLPNGGLSSQARTHGIHIQATRGLSFMVMVYSKRNAVME